MAKVPITTSGGKTMKRSPISSMGGVFSSLKGNMKSMANSMFGLQNDLKQDNQQKQKSYQTIRRNLSKNKDLKKKKTAEKNLEKSNLVGDSIGNITKFVAKTGGGIFGKILKVLLLIGGAWLLKNAENIIKTAQKAFKIIQDVWNGVSKFVSGTIDIVKGIAKLVLATGANIISFDFADKSGRIKDALSDVELGWEKLNSAITGAELVLDDPESEAFKEDFEEGGDLDEQKEEDEEGVTNQKDTNTVGEDPNNKNNQPAIGDYKVIETSRGNKYRVWDGGKWGAKTNVKPRAGKEWRGETPPNIDDRDETKMETKEQVSAKDEVYGQVRNAKAKLDSQPKIDKSDKIKDKVDAVTPNNQPKVINVIDNREQTNMGNEGRKPEYKRQFIRTADDSVTTKHQQNMFDLTLV